MRNPASWSPITLVMTVTMPKLDTDILMADPEVELVVRAQLFMAGLADASDQQVVFERYLEGAADVIATAWSAHVNPN